MQKILLALVATSSLGACVAEVRGGRPRQPPPAQEPVRVVEPPHHEHHGPPPAAPPDRGPRVIEGTIRDAETRQPIDRASIDITSPAFRGERTVQVGPDGRYRTGEIPPGEFTIRVRREGFEVFQQKAVMSDGTAHLDFVLVRKRR